MQRLCLDRDLNTVVANLPLILKSTGKPYFVYTKRYLICLRSLPICVIYFFDLGFVLHFQFSFIICCFNLSHVQHLVQAIIKAPFHLEFILSLILLKIM